MSISLGHGLESSRTAGARQRIVGKLDSATFHDRGEFLRCFISPVTTRPTIDAQFARLFDPEGWFAFLAVLLV
jgi:hypothetical protein